MKSTYPSTKMYSLYKDFSLMFMDLFVLYSIMAFNQLFNTIKENSAKPTPLEQQSTH